MHNNIIKTVYNIIILQLFSFTSFETPGMSKTVDLEGPGASRAPQSHSKPFFCVDEPKERSDNNWGTSWDREREKDRREERSEKKAYKIGKERRREKR